MTAPRAYLPILAILAAAAPGGLASQRDTTAQLAGTAKSAYNGQPLSGVMIAVPGARRFAVTDSTGAFQLGHLPSGRQRVRIAYAGRETEEYEFALRAGRVTKLAIVLDVEAVELAPVVVEARAPGMWRDLAGFYERRKWYGAFNRFFTREDIERTHAVSVASLLAREGIYTRCTIEGCVPTRTRRGMTCVVPVSVDGMPFWEFDYDHLSIDDVAGVEVYRGDIWVPPQAFVSVSGGAPRCGAVQIWLR